LLKRYAVSKDVLQDPFILFSNIAVPPTSQILAPPRVSIDSSPQSVQTSPSSQALQQTEVLTLRETLSDEPPSIEVYTAYAYQDEVYFKVIKRLLQTLALQGWRIYCLESEVVRSREWRDREYLTTAHLILLLISGGFLSSPFCYCDDMRSVVSKHGNGVFVVPIIVEYAESQLSGAPFGCLGILVKY
jgi:hypothetical protein